MKTTRLADIRKHFGLGKINKIDLRRFLSENGPFQEVFHGPFCSWESCGDLNGIGKVESRKLVEMGLVIPDALSKSKISHKKMNKTQKKKLPASCTGDTLSINVVLDKNEETDAQVIATIKELLPHFEKRGMDVKDVVWAILHSVVPDSRDLWDYLDPFLAEWDEKESQQKMP